MDDSPRQAGGVHDLVALFDPVAGEERRPPWNWSVLTAEERIILVQAIAAWVETFNVVVAVTEDDLIPPCWPQHDDLAQELPVLFWLWYGAYVHRDATPVRAADYRSRFLPSFRSRLDSMLGASPRECRHGRHPSTWRSDADSVAEHRPERTIFGPALTELCDRLGALHYGFPPDEFG